MLSFLEGFKNTSFNSLFKSSNCLKLVIFLEFLILYRYSMSCVGLAPLLRRIKLPTHSTVFIMKDEKPLYPISK